jgi:hypothetical protein
MTPASPPLRALLGMLSLVTLLSCLSVHAAPLRIATFNVSLHGEGAATLVERLEGGDEGARKVAAIIQRIRPDLLLLNEFDYDPDGRARTLFLRDYLAIGQFGEQPIEYAHHHDAPVNTGEPSGLDLSGDGRSDGPGDAWGFGAYPGQYGMLVLSQYPIGPAGVRSFRHLRWAALPHARRPLDPVSGEPFHSDAVWQRMRLSSKSHWDVPIDTPLGTVHLLAGHPTPPVFDGPENRNGLRNHDEIRLWAEYLTTPAGAWLVDDDGRSGGLSAQAAFVIAGDYNADPVDGDSVPGAIQQLLLHPRVLRHPAPRSQGAIASTTRIGGINLEHRGDPAEDTAEFSPRAGNLRVDYVLPSRQFAIVDSGVFWPLPGEPGSEWLDGSDHRMVWIDLRLAEPAK